MINLNHSNNTDIAPKRPSNNYHLVIVPFQCSLSLQMIYKSILIWWIFDSDASPATGSHFGRPFPARPRGDNSSSAAARRAESAAPGCSWQGEPERPPGGQRRLQRLRLRRRGSRIKVKAFLKTEKKKKRKTILVTYDGYIVILLKVCFLRCLFPEKSLEDQQLP